VVMDGGIPGTYNYYFFDFDRWGSLKIQLDSLNRFGNAELYVAHSYLASRLRFEVVSPGLCILFLLLYSSTNLFFYLLSPVFLHLTLRLLLL